MKTKILIFAMVFMLLVFSGGTAFLFYIVVTMDDKPVEAASVKEAVYMDNADLDISDDAISQNGQQIGIIQRTKTADSGREETRNQQPLRIMAVGDILMGRTVKQKVEIQPQRYVYPFEEVVNILKKGDVIFGNLEEPITASTKGLTGIKQGGKYVLKNDPEAINGLIFAGFNLLSLANNHILDYYEQGLLDTMKILEDNNIKYAGAGRNLEEARKMTVIEKKDLKIGMLAYTEMAEILYKGDPPLMFAAKEDKSGVAPLKCEYIIEDIKKAREHVDILIVSLHWGVEYSYEPLAEQIELAHILIDNGADILIGHHAHRCQGVEIYKGKPIFYNLGNFLFDQNNPQNQEGFIFDMVLEDKKLVSLQAIPFIIFDKSRIVPQRGQGASTLLRREHELCVKLDTKCRIEDDKLVFVVE